VPPGVQTAVTVEVHWWCWWGGAGRVLLFHSTHSSSHITHHAPPSSRPPGRRWQGNSCHRKRRSGPVLRGPVALCCGICKALRYRHGREEACVVVTTGRVKNNPSYNQQGQDTDPPSTVPIALYATELAR
jgi:hypothetical protein